MKTPRVALSYFLGVSLWLVGCAGGQTGQESGATCKETGTVLALDATSPLGFSPNQVIATTGSSATAPLTWLSTTNFSYGPESGTSSIDISLQTKGARFVKSEASGTTLAYPICADRVEIDVSATAATERGALDETFDGVLLAARVNDVWLNHIFDPRSLAGTFAIDSATLGTRELIRLTLQAHFQAALLTGTFSAGIQDGGAGSADSNVSFTELPLACIGESPDAGVVCSP